MRWFFVACLCLNGIGNVYAETLESPNGVVPDTSPASVIAPSISALQSDAKDVTKIANDHLRVMREEIKKSATKKSSFLFFSSSITPLNQALLNDLNDYLNVYGQKSLSVEAVQLKAILHNRMDQNEALAMDFLTILSAYSGSRYEKASRKGLSDLLNDQLKYHKAVIDDILNLDFSTMPTQEDRLFALLTGLSAIDDKDFNPVIAKACSQFLVRYPDYRKNDMIQNILAAHAGKNYHVAIYHYRTLLTIYPQSHLRPNALYSIGEIQRTGLKAYEDAVISYKQVIKQFSSSDVAKQSYIKLALTQSKHLRLYQEALMTLNTTVEKYADDPVGKQALQMLGEIYSKKTKEYAKAVESYRKLSTIFSGDDGLEALQEAEKIASSSMRDYALVIAIDEQLIRDYDNSPLAPEKMMNIANIYDKKLKQKSSAIATYQRVIESYPNSKQAKQASANIKKLEKTGAKSGLF
ncbi:MAG: tetratricopeptide repeat protein [Mariprofundaceae bacterium]|nr:tetratricopeptide repeat protein [Mariprofundaceae bacterium]